MNELTSEVSLLRELYKKCKDLKEREKYQALYLVASGYSYLEAAFIVCKNEETISIWVDKYLQEKSVKDKPREGRPPTVTKEIEEEITKIIDDNDPSNGKANCTIVDCNFLQAYFFEKYQLKITAEAIRKHLRKLNYHYAKSEYEFIKRDNEKRKQFLSNILPQLKEAGFDINFLDEARTKLHPKPGYFWTKNPRPVVKTNCSHAGITIKGSVNPISGEAILETYDRNDRTSHFEFIKKFISIKEISVKAGLVKQVLLIVDNLSVHKVKEVMELVSKYDWLKMIFQPTYSPDLNLIEWLWGFLRRKKLNGQVFATIEEMKQKLGKIFTSLTPEIIRKTCSVAILERQAQKIGIT